MNKIKVAFFGTSDRSQPILECLDTNFDLVLCATKTDRIVGRHRKTEKTLVKKWGEREGIDVFEIENFKKDENGLVKALIKHGVELIVVADFGFIIGKELIDKYKNKIINIHFSLLPKYRGANPIQAAIIQGEKETGITYLLMTLDLDEGPILHQIKLDIKGNETSGELYEVLFKRAAQNLSDVVKKYLNKEIVPVEQNHEKASFYYSPSHPKSTYIYKEDARINWCESLKQIERKVRAFNPWPIAWTTLGDLEKSEKAEQMELKEGVKKDLRIKIYSAELKEGKIIPKTVQVTGKNKTKWEDFKNGYTVQAK